MKVTLLGDSIRQIGYGTLVPELLKDEFEVWQPSENCRFAKYTLRGMFDWKDAMEGTRIVHWNNGLWDQCDLFGDGPFTSVEEYVQTMVRIAKILLSRYDRVIFATTTPVLVERAYDANENVRVLNEAIVPVLQEMGVIINDLHSLVSTNMEAYIREDDKLHLSEEGIKVCARQVADIIRKTAAELET